MCNLKLLNHAVLAALMCLALSGCDKLGFIGIDKDNDKNNFSAPGAGAATRLSIQGTASTPVNTCTPYTVFPVDVNGLVTTQFQPFFQYNLSVVGGATLYSDSSCSTAATAVFPALNGVALFYAKDTIKENVVLNAITDTFSLQGSRAVMFTAGPAVAYDLIVPPTAAQNTCVQTTIKTLDAFNNITPVHPNLTANVTDITIPGPGITPVGVFSDATCLTVTGTANVASGSDTGTFYVQSSTLGPRTLSVSSSGIAADTGNIEFLAGNSPRIGLSGPAGVVLANSCSTVRVESQRNDASPLIVTGSPLTVTVNVATGISTSLFSDSSCAVALGPTVNIPMNGYFTNIYAKSAQAPQVVALQGSATGYLTGSANLNIIPVPAARVQIGGTPASIEAGNCGVGEVSLLDSFGNAAYVSANTLVGLSAGIGVGNSTQTEFFSSNNCSGAAISSLTIPMCSGLGACANSLGFSFRPKKIGLAALSASSQDLIGSTVQVAVVTPTGLPFAIVLTRLTDPAVAGACIEFKVETKDQYDNFVNVSPALDVTSTATSASGLAAVYSDNACAAVINTVTVASGEHEKHFFVKDPKAEQVTVTLSKTTPSLNAQHIMTLIPGPVKKLVWDNVPATAPATFCSGPVTVSERDQFDNVTVGAVIFNLSATNGVKYYADNQCFNEVTSNFINTGLSVSNPMYFTGPNTGAAVLTATATAPASVTIPAVANITMTTAPALHVGLSCSPNNLLDNNCTNVPAGFCMPVYATSFDANDVKFIPSIMNISVNLSASSANAATLYADAACTTALSGNNLTITPNLNPASFFIRNTVAENYTVTGVASVGPNALLNVTMSSAVASRLRVLSSPGAASFLTNECAGPYAVRMEDQFGNAAIKSTASTVSFISSSLNGLGFPNTLGFFNDSACSGSTVSIAANSSTASFYIKSATAGNLSIVPSGTNLTPVGDRVVQITEGALVRFMIGSTNVSSVNFQNVVVGSTSPSVTIDLKNVSTGEAALIDSLGLPSAPFIKGAASTCPATPFTLQPGGSCNVVYSFSPTAVGPATASLVANYHGALGSPAASRSVAFSGAGVNAPFVAPFLSLASIDFGSVNVGSSSMIPLDLKNVNAFPVVIEGVQSPIAPFTVSLQSPCSNTFPFTMAANSQCQVRFTYAPTAQGTQSSGFSVFYDNPEAQSAGQTSPTLLTGTGVLAATTLSISPSSWDFGNYVIGSGAAIPVKNLTVTNTGTAQATLTGFTGVQSPFSTTLGTCGTLNPNQTCEITVSFSPSQVASYSNTAVLRYNVQNGQTNLGTNFTVTGAGVAPGAANLVVEPSSWAFGNTQQNTSAGAKTFTLRNTGSQAADTMSFLNVQSPFSLSMGTCIGQLAANATCQFTANFTPTQIASYSATLTLSWRNVISGNTQSSTAALVLTGAGVQAQTQAKIEIEYLSYDYGYVPMGGWHGRYILIKNTGQKTATNIAVVMASGASQVGFTGNLGFCGTSLAGGNSCWIDTRFQPIYYGRVNSSVSIRYNTETATVNSTPMSMFGTGY